MADNNDVIVFCEDWRDVYKAIDRTYPSLSQDERRRVSAMVFAYRRGTSDEQLHAKINGKSVASLLAEFESTHKTTVVDSGQVGGMKYAITEVEPNDK